MSKIGTAVTNKIDDINPTTARIEVTSTGATSVSVKAYGGDNETGVAKYIFQKSTSSSTSGFTSAGENTSTSTTSTKSISTNPETTYWFRVIVEDKAGNQTPSDPVSTKTKMVGPVISVEDQNTWATSKTFSISTRSGYITKYTTDDTIPSLSNGSEYISKQTVYKKTKVRAIYIKTSTNEMSEVSYLYISYVDTEYPSISSASYTHGGNTSDGLPYFTISGAKATDDGAIKSYELSYSNSDMSGSGSSWYGLSRVQLGESCQSLTGFAGSVYVKATDYVR